MSPPVLAPCHKKSGSRRLSASDPEDKHAGMSQVTPAAKCRSHLRVQYARYKRTFGQLDISRSYNPCRAAQPQDSGIPVDNLGIRQARCGRRTTRSKSHRQTSLLFAMQPDPCQIADHAGIVLEIAGLLLVG